MYKFNKDQLLTESQELSFEEIDFDTILETVEVDEETKEALKEALESASKVGAVKMVESHLDKLVISAEAQVEAITESIEAKFDELLAESVEDFLLAIGEEWLEENEVAIANSAKADLFEGLLGGLKDVFIGHNVSIPDDQINLVEELTEMEHETRMMANKIHAENAELKESLIVMKRDQMIEQLSEGMTVSQKETFSDLAKAVKLDSNYEGRITKLSESLTATKAVATPKETALIESLKLGSKVQEEKSKETEQKLIEGANQTPQKTAEEIRREELRKQM